MTAAAYGRIRSVTRELKLALIVGFAIVLTVAILVSDHLSKARQASLADIGAANATRVSAKLPEEPIKSPDELLPATLQPAMSVTEPVLTRSSETTDASQAILPPSKQTQLASTETDAAPVVIGLGSAALQTTLLQPVNSDATYARRDMVENAPSNQITPTTGSTPAEKTATLSPAGDAILKSVDEKKTAAEIKTEPKQSRTTALPIGPNDKTHTIAENESLYAISKRYYGTGNLWRQLAAANAGRVSENGSARVGTKILIPSRDSLLGKTDATRSAKTESKPATKPEVKPEPKAVAKASDAKARSYTVRPGDSLGRIAARELGSSKRLGEIAALNKMDPDDDLLVGAILKLPSK
jgi:nucleoid-associated protein YgaU